MFFQRSVLLCFTFSLVALVRPVSIPMAEWTNSPVRMRARDRVLRTVDDNERAVLRGNVHPLASVKDETEVVPPDYWMHRMVLHLKPDTAQQQALDALLAAQYEPTSARYHHWITPKMYGELFGVSSNDLAQLTNWLELHGLQVEEVMPSRLGIIFSGHAYQVESAFHPALRTYKVGGELHHANARDPEIPLALSDVVGGVLSLHDFRSQPMHFAVKKITPEFSSGSSHYLSPADFSVIYNIDPLYGRAISGAGQSIAIVGRSNINLADVRIFRSTFGLPKNDPQVILNGANPGILSAAEESEALLDVEWSGAIARDAKIKLVISRSTSASDGVFLSSQYVVNHNFAPVMSVSFGLCEAALGTSGNNFFNNLWKQAAAQGITVFVSSGDSGAAGCDPASSRRALKGRAVNGLCSSPYSVCVGGTQFNEGSAASLYWSSANTTGSLASARSYIPEMAWNESGTRGLWSTGGGASSRAYSQAGLPEWLRVTWPQDLDPWMGAPW
jgi:pseudomonalisin